MIQFILVILRIGRRGSVASSEVLLQRGSVENPVIRAVNWYYYIGIQLILAAAESYFPLTLYLLRVLIIGVNFAIEIYGV